MKRLDLILNGKGGVGKSFFAVNFVQFLKDRGIAHTAIDSDNENSTLKRFHPDTRFLDLNNRRELDGIFGALEKSNLVVMDCRAASTDLFIDYFTEIDLSAVLSAMGATLTLVMPVNHESDIGMPFCLPGETNELRATVEDGKICVTASGFTGNLSDAAQRREWLKQKYKLKDGSFLFVEQVADILRNGVTRCGRVGEPKEIPQSRHAARSRHAACRNRFARRGGMDQQGRRANPASRIPPRRNAASHRGTPTPRRGNDFGNDNQ